MTTTLASWTAPTVLANLEPYVGRTPLLQLQKIFRKKNVQLLAKAEWMQMGGSVKSRPAYRIIRQAVERGDLVPGMTLLDASSGNTGIAYATFARESGIPFTICLPENASRERKEILAHLGAVIEFTSPFESTDGAQTRAREMAEAEPDRYYYADQYNNADNFLAHYHSTAPEIIAQTGGRVTHFIAGLGTTGTFTGTALRLQEEIPGIVMVALQPDNPMHGLEGWKHLETAKVPGIYRPALAHLNREVDTMVAYDLIRDAAKFEGLQLSPSSAANLAGALTLAEELDEGVVVTIFPDNADRYSEVTQSLFS